MYKGALKTEKLLTGKALVMAQIAIERALDRCQQDFDNTHLGLTRKIDHTLKTQNLAKKYDPEEEIRRLLSESVNYGFFTKNVWPSKSRDLLRWNRPRT